MWIPDLFMERVKENATWPLMCPDECPGLSDCHSDEFRELYIKYEMEGKVRKTVNAQEVWFSNLSFHLIFNIKFSKFITMTIT
jgi:ribonucleotide reductase alpha subunit